MRNSQVIVLDEPTSAMDPQAEYEIFKRFREIIQDQTAILITHRLSTVRMADFEFLLWNKVLLWKVAIMRTLIKNNGVYAHLFNTQAQNYRY